MATDNRAFINAFRNLRQEYFRTKRGDDPKIQKLTPLSAAPYTEEEWRDINRLRRALENAQHAARVAGDNWRMLLTTTMNGKPIEMARIVTNARRARGVAKRAVREAEIFYRMAWEIPVLERWKKGQQTEAETKTETVSGLLRGLSILDYVRKA